MKPAPHFLPPRSAVIYAHTRKMIDSTSMCVRKFATALAEQYIALVPVDLRTVPFRWGVTLDDLMKAEKHNAQIVGRYMDGTVKVLPADLEDAWVLALPEPFRSACERDLAARRGRVSFAVPACDTAEAEVIAPVLKEAGELCAVWGQVISDRRITRDEVMRLVRESDDVLAAVMQLRQYALDRVEQGDADA
jgi:hypothetical protein